MKRLQIYNTFCEDIRREFDGRLSLMGIYSGHIQLPPGATKIDRLKVHAVVTIPQRLDLNTTRVRVTFNDVGLKETCLSSATAEKLLSDAKGNIGDDGEFLVGFIINLNDMPAEKRGILRVYVHAGEDMCEGMLLRVIPGTQKKIAPESA